VGEKVTDVKTARVVHPALRVTHGDHLSATLFDEVGRRGADLAEPLDHHARPFHRHVLALERLQRRDHYAPAGRLAAAERTADGQRLAGDHRRHRVAAVHGVRVHDPGHLALAGPHVRRRDVPLRAH
jgi:hypothetical protein